MASIINKLKQTYLDLNKETVGSDLLDQLYSTDVHFADPLHSIHSLAELKSYFEGMYKNVIEIHFDYIDTLENDKTAFLTWVMTFRHPKLNSGQAIKVEGTTHIEHDGEKVTLHRDYFDSTHMLFEHIPVIGSAIKIVKKRIQ